MSEAGKYILDQTKASDKLDLPVSVGHANHRNNNNNSVPMAASTPLIKTRGGSKQRVAMTRQAPSTDGASLVKRPKLTDMDRIIEQEVKPFLTAVDSAGNLVLRKRTTPTVVNSGGQGVKVSVGWVLIKEE